MKKVLILGATGMVGAEIFNHCLNSDEISEVIVIVRNDLKSDHPKLTTIKHSDFTNYSSLQTAFQQIDAAWFCLGVYTGAVPDAMFKEITVDYAKAFATMLWQETPKSSLSFLSGAGADLTEKSKTPFARYKGMAENYLLAANAGPVFIFRPGYIYPSIKRKEPNFMYAVMRSLYPLLRVFGPKFSITSADLAAAMFFSAFNHPPKKILENVDILNYLIGFQHSKRKENKV